MYQVPTKIIIGLGNPSKEYANNRHNIGFMLTDKLAALGEFHDFNDKFSGLFSRGTLWGSDFILFKPTTFMNLSGEAVLKLKTFFKCENKDIFVIHDELDIDFNTIRCKKGGGNNGHNGLKSIDSKIGNDYHRIRFGIGRPEFKSQVSSYVLSDFSNDEVELISNNIPTTLRKIKEYIFAN